MTPQDKPGISRDAVTKILDMFSRKYRRVIELEAEVVALKLQVTRQKLKLKKAAAKARAG
jgi:hypothetical protein